jgi:2-amino-4-hydroxy-6-hydroxymethyldihydropteridine diphosphokinase
LQDKTLEQIAAFGQDHLYQIKNRLHAQTLDRQPPVLNPEQASNNKDSPMSYYLLGLGSNIRPEHNLSQACTRLAQEHELLLTSPVVATATVGSSFHFPFRNQLVLIRCLLTAEQLKQQLLAIETEFGREPKSPERKLHDRTIDIDILANDASIQGCLNTPLEDSYYSVVMRQWQSLQTLNV